MLRTFQIPLVLISVLSSFAIVLLIKKVLTTCRGLCVSSSQFSICTDPEGKHRVQTPLEYHKATGFLSNTSLDPLENQATKPAFIVRPS